MQNKILIFVAVLYLSLLGMILYSTFYVDTTCVNQVTFKRGKHVYTSFVPDKHKDNTQKWLEGRYKMKVKVTSVYRVCHEN